MTIQSIGKASYLIILEKDDPIGQAADGSYKKSDYGEQLCRLAFGDAACLGKRIHIEIYPGRDEIMAFIRLGGDETGVFAFESLEDLLPAVSGCRDMFSSELLWDGERYILILTPWEGDPVPYRISEYGERLIVRDELIPHLREQARCLISGNALERLSSLF